MNLETPVLTTETPGTQSFPRCACPASRRLKHNNRSTAQDVFWIPHCSVERENICLTGLRIEVRSVKSPRCERKTPGVFLEDPPEPIPGR
ncbi:hypothetical protein E2C01_096735 [Portunus trituberculatus]|uniref:Uncharacterized protein n=1 Tax=Portunus trituberculatus TaxID=210409 RepID=A0A5B7K3V5_PORTR|nr:hypothetical protein [Portunus trituberculatus]